MLRRDRVHHTGASNLFILAKRNPQPEQVHSASVIEERATHQPPQSARTSKSPMRTKGYAEAIQRRAERSAVRPRETTQTFYEAFGKIQNEKVKVGNPRLAHLEEKEKRAPAFLGDSDICNDRHFEKYRNSSPKTNALKNFLDEPRIPETQRRVRAPISRMSRSVNYEGINLHANVDMHKVKEARKMLRRKYAGRISLQKVYQAWNEDKTDGISVDEVYRMSQKIGLGLNIDEARVLLATVDKNSDGKLTLDEFTDLVFNKNDKVEIDLNLLATNIGGDYLKKKQEIEARQAEIQPKAKGETEAPKTMKRNNQINLLLKNKLRDLHKAFEFVDRDKHGVLNFPLFDEALSKLEINEVMMSHQDIRNLYNTHRIAQNKLDYKSFMKTLEKFEYVFDKSQAEDSKPAEYRGKTEAAIAAMKKAEKEKDFLNIVDCRGLTFNKMDSVYTKSRKISKAVKRFLPSKKELQNYLVANLSIAPTEIDRYLFSRDQVKEVVHGLFKRFDVTNLDEKDFQGFFTSILYNKHEKTNLNEIANTIYNENENQFWEKVQMRKKGPGPIEDIHLENKSEIINLNESRTGHNASNSIAMRRNSAGDCENLKAEGVLPAIGTARYSSGFDSPIKVTTRPQTDRKLGDILQQLDTKVFCYKKSALKAFREFDLDGDGFVSHRDIVKKLEAKQLVAEEDIPKVIDYIDPEHKGYVDFSEFSKKIRPNMAYDNERGEAERKTVITFAKPEVEKEVRSASVTKRALETARKSFEPDTFNSWQPRYVTKSGANPPWVNTFLNMQPSSQTGLFLAEEKRLSRPDAGRTLFQSEDKERKRLTYEKKLQAIRDNQDNLTRRLREEDERNAMRDNSILKRKRMAQFNYDQTAKLKNTCL